MKKQKKEKLMERKKLELKKRYGTKEKGITLIALVVTIIVLLILAAICINLLLGDNGIIKTAQNAREESDNATKKERDDLTKIDEWIRDYTSENGNEDIYKSGIWRVKANTKRYAMSVPVKLYSQYTILNLNEYKEKYIEKELNKMLLAVGFEMEYSIDDYLIERMQLMEGFTEKEYYENREYFITGGLGGGLDFNNELLNQFLPEGFDKSNQEELKKICKEIYADYMLTIFGYTTENIGQIENEYEEYKSKSQEIPSEVKNITYTITFPDGTTKQVLGSDLQLFKESYVITSNGNYNISIKATNSQEDNLTIVANNIVLKEVEDEWYAYKWDNWLDGYSVSVKDRTLTSYGKMKSNINGAPIRSWAHLFYECTNLTEFSFDGIDSRNILDMSFMFAGCNNLSNLDVSNFDTSNVKYIEHMFNGCKNLSSLDVSNFDTSNVTDMQSMFDGCNSLSSLDVSNFDTSNVKYMPWMFNGCKNLSSLDVSNFDTSNVTNMQSMFYGCNSLSSLDVSNFDTSNVTTMYGMFCGCDSLNNLDVSNFDTSNVTNMQWMFNGCKNLSSLNLSNLNTSNVTIMNGMFYNCSSLQTLDISNFNTSNVTEMGSIFSGCSSLQTLDLSNFNTRKVTIADNLFSNCTNLKTIYKGDDWVLDGANVAGMFTNCGTSELIKK